MWRAETSRGHEASKVRWFAIPYLRGRGIDVGCGNDKVLPSAIGVDPVVGIDGRKIADVQADGRRLDLFADASLDYVFSSHFLEHVEEWRGALAEWWRVLRPGGHLILYLPHAHHYPRRGTPGASLDHKHDFVPEDVLEAMKQVMAASGGDVLEDEERCEGNEYSFFQVYRKGSGGPVSVTPWRRHPRSCLVIRFGGYGDALMASSILPHLKREGWWVAFHTEDTGAEALRHDPHVDEFVVAPPATLALEQLGIYWRALATRYDRVINLCEAIEGVLLKVPNQAEYYWPDEVRRRLCAFNYCELLHAIAQVPYGFEQRFHPSPEERQWVLEMAGRERTVAWALSGSAHHKVWPWVGPALVQLLERHPDCRVFLLGGPQDREKGETLLECLRACQGRLSGRVTSLVDRCTMRQAMALAQLAHVVVGPETALLNAVALESNRKVGMARRK